jgi:hypothetical protein
MLKSDISTSVLKVPLHVIILREPFGEFFTLVLDNRHTEELEPEDCRQWFKDRGADMQKVEKALDQTWNFYRAEVNIRNPKEPPMPQIPYAPKL